MAEVESDCFPSKRIRLSPEREADILDTSIEQVNAKHGSGIDQEPCLTTYSNIQSSNVEPSSSREQDGCGDEFHKHDQIEGDDFPSCFSVEDDNDNSEEHHYQPIAGPMGWVQRQMNLGINPREILSYMIPHAKVPSHLQDDHIMLWKIVIDLLTSPTPRQKLNHVNTLDDVISLLHGCKNIVVLTGAGVSVSCGIPDFRSRDGIYARLSEEYPDLPDPQAMFDISYFNQNPYPFFKFAKEIYPGQFKPSLSHRFIHQIEKHGSLLRNYSQNIDTLEQIAGITNVIQCHGSFSTASCTNCKYKVSSSDIKDDIFNQRIPQCTKCKPEGELAIMKPDIVFFGENLPSDFYHHLEEDSEKADLLIVIGSSLKVRPVALIPSRIDADVPQILINREPLPHMTFDVELLGDCDVIVAELCKRLGGSWTDILDGSQTLPVNKSFYPGMDKNVVTADAGNPGEEIPKHHTETTPNKPLESNQSIQNSELSKQENLSTLNTVVSQPSVPEQPVIQSESSLDSSNKQPLSTVSMVTNDQEMNSVGVQSVGQDTRSAPTNEQREGLLVPLDRPLATEHLSNKEQTSQNNEDPALFIHHPPGRYIFYGAEIANSPIHSPFGSPRPSDDGNSDDCSENGSLSRDDFECTAFDPNGYSSSGDGSEGYGSGVMSNTDLTNYDLKLITGVLGNYQCVSEENSVMSGLDLISDGNGEQAKDDLVHVSNSLDGVTQSIGISISSSDVIKTDIRDPLDISKDNTRDNDDILNQNDVSNVYPQDRDVMETDVKDPIDLSNDNSTDNRSIELKGMTNVDSQSSDMKTELIDTLEMPQDNSRYNINVVYQNSKADIDLSSNDMKADSRDPIGLSKDSSRDDLNVLDQNNKYL